MDYEQKYKKALKIIKDNLDALDEITETGAKVVNIQSIKNCFYKAFPELKESEDERIRKALIKMMHDTPNNLIWVDYGISKKDAIAWLEKQGEQKPAYKVEPKFKIGDWVIDKQNIVHQIANVIENVTNHTYGYDIVGGGYFNDSIEGVRLWTIKDAKDGEVLVASDNSIFIFKEVWGTSCKHYIALTSDNEIEVNTKLDKFWETTRGVKPSTKEQRDLLFSKMKESGYEWKAETKELIKVPRSKESTGVLKQLLDEEKSWSKEDERICNNIIRDITIDKSMCKYEVGKAICDEQIE